MLQNSRGSVDLSETPPFLSVVIPARNCPLMLRQCLSCLADSTYRNFEVIVVDDASSDETVSVAHQGANSHVLSLEKQSGPAAARNFGASSASGEYILFLDADVCVHVDTLKKIVEKVEANPDTHAIFGSYDTAPHELNIVSQYRNLMHHFVHQTGEEEASTFWAGCGLVKRSVFNKVGGFDANYSRPCIEDIEFGIRMREKGFRIRLEKEIQVTHLKRWTAWGMLKADVFDRGIPWTKLILNQGALPDDLNLKKSQRFSVCLAWLLWLMFFVYAWQVPAILVLPVSIVLAIVGLDTWSTTRRIPTFVRLFAVSFTLGVSIYLAMHLSMMSLLGFILCGGILLMNAPFYLFFARERNPLFAAIVFPLHVSYYSYSGAAFAIGLGSHLMSSVRSLVRSQDTT